MLTINLLPKPGPVPSVFASATQTQTQALQGSSQFVMMDASAGHLIIDRPSRTRMTMSVVAQGTPVVFASETLLQKYWYISGPAGLIIGMLILYLFARASEKIWPPQDEVPLLREDELGENFIGPRFAPGSRDLPKGKPLDE